MLKQASVSEIRNGKVTRRDGKIVLAMCHYPRGVAREMVDEYTRALAPTDKLLGMFLKLRDQLNDHNKAFAAARYEALFALDKKGMDILESLSNDARHNDVYLVCQCKDEEKCHRDLLLILAEECFSAKVCKRSFQYKSYAARVARSKFELIQDP